MTGTPPPLWDLTPFTLYVPTRDALWAVGIAPGSAIVSDATPRAGVLLVDFDGNIHARSRTYVQCAIMAADRHASKYPTVARRHAPVRDLVEVGTLDIVFGRVTLTDAAALAAWLGRPAGDDDLLADGFYAHLREVAAWSPAQRAALRELPDAERVRYERAGLP